ncbi:MAG: DUF4364 family protein [Firmicutes bacterium]|nr:DUF4364 family protein [Bacillota bacterium]
MAFEPTGFVADDMAKKLILLFIFEKMEFPLTDASISEVVVLNPSWLSYMDFRDALYVLGEAKFIHRSTSGTDPLFCITQSGRACLSHFYTKIPASIREEITQYSRDNKNRFKRSQEYTYDYFKNADGTYTILLKIKEGGSIDNMLEVRLKVSTRTEAVKATSKWKDRAPNVYEGILNILSDENN